MSGCSQEFSLCCCQRPQRPAPLLPRALPLPLPLGALLFQDRLLPLQVGLQLLAILAEVGRARDGGVGGLARAGGDDLVGWNKRGVDGTGTRWEWWGSPEKASLRPRGVQHITIGQLKVKASAGTDQAMLSIGTDGSSGKSTRYQLSRRPPAHLSASACTATNGSALNTTRPAMSVRPAHTLSCRCRPAACGRRQARKACNGVVGVDTTGQAAGAARWATARRRHRAQPLIGALPHLALWAEYPCLKQRRTLGGMEGWHGEGHRAKQALILAVQIETERVKCQQDRRGAGCHAASAAPLVTWRGGPCFLLLPPACQASCEH